jgi:hypothetical protein
VPFETPAEWNGSPSCFLGVLPWETSSLTALSEKTAVGLHNLQN